MQIFSLLSHLRSRDRSIYSPAPQDLWFVTPNEVRPRLLIWKHLNPKFVIHVSMLWLVAPVSPQAARIRNRERESERERERERDRERQTDRHRQREIETERDRQTDTDRER